MDKNRYDMSPALGLVAAELCETKLTDGFCHPRNVDQCKCWDRAAALKDATWNAGGFSCNALVWILRNRKKIEAEANRLPQTTRDTQT